MKQYGGRISFVAAFLLLSLLIGVPVNAIESQTQTSPSTSVSTDAETRQKAVDDIKQKISEVRAEVKERLSDAKRKVCENHQASIQKLMTNIIADRQKQIDHISQIADSVEAFYQKRGHTLSNYDALVSDVTTKKAAAQAALDAAKPAATFSCDSEGPGAQLQEFRDKRAVFVDAIKAYRQSVKNLIVGVKSVQPDKEAQS